MALARAQARKKRRGVRAKKLSSTADENREGDMEKTPPILAPIRVKTWRTLQFMVYPGQNIKNTKKNNLYANSRQQAGNRFEPSEDAVLLWEKHGEATVHDFHRSAPNNRYQRKGGTHSKGGVPPSKISRKRGGRKALQGPEGGGGGGGGVGGGGVG